MLYSHEDAESVGKVLTRYPTPTESQSFEAVRRRKDKAERLGTLVFQYARNFRKQQLVQNYLLHLGLRAALTGYHVTYGDQACAAPAGGKQTASENVMHNLDRENYVHQFVRVATGEVEVGQTLLPTTTMGYSVDDIWFEVRDHLNDRLASLIKRNANPEVTEKCLEFQGLILADWTHNDKCYNDFKSAFVGSKPYAAVAWRCPMPSPDVSEEEFQSAESDRESPPPLEDTDVVLEYTRTGEQDVDLEFGDDPSEGFKLQLNEDEAKEFEEEERRSGPRSEVHVVDNTATSKYGFDGLKEDGVVSRKRSAPPLVAKKTSSRHKRWNKKLADKYYQVPRPKHYDVYDYDRCLRDKDVVPWAVFYEGKARDLTIVPWWPPRHYSSEHGGVFGHYVIKAVLDAGFQDAKRILGNRGGELPDRTWADIYCRAQNLLEEEHYVYPKSTVYNWAQRRADILGEKVYFEESKVDEKRRGPGKSKRDVPVRNKAKFSDEENEGHNDQTRRRLPPPPKRVDETPEGSPARKFHLASKGDSPPQAAPSGLGGGDSSQSRKGPPSEYYEEEIGPRRKIKRFPQDKSSEWDIGVCRAYAALYINNNDVGGRQVEPMWKSELMACAQLAHLRLDILVQQVQLACRVPFELAVRTGRDVVSKVEFDPPSALLVPAFMGYTRYVEQLPGENANDHGWRRFIVAFLGSLQYWAIRSRGYNAVVGQRASSGAVIHFVKIAKDRGLRDIECWARTKGGLYNMLNFMAKSGPQLDRDVRDAKTETEHELQEGLKVLFGRPQGLANRRSKAAAALHQSRYRDSTGVCVTARVDMSKNPYVVVPLKETDSMFQVQRVQSVIPPLTEKDAYHAREYLARTTEQIEQMTVTNEEDDLLDGHN